MISVRVFTKLRVFPVFASIDITVYLYGKNVLYRYFFYNIAQKKYKITSMDERRKNFQVKIELCGQRSVFTNAIS